MLLLTACGTSKKTAKAQAYKKAATAANAASKNPKATKSNLTTRL